MEVRPGGASGGSYLGDGCSLGNSFAFFNVVDFIMSVVSGQASAVVDDDKVAVAAQSSGKFHCAGGGGVDGRTGAIIDINSGMPPAEILGDMLGSSWPDKAGASGR